MHIDDKTVCECFQRNLSLISMTTQSATSHPWVASQRIRKHSGVVSVLSIHSNQSTTEANTET